MTRTKPVLSHCCLSHIQPTPNGKAFASGPTWRGQGFLGSCENTWPSSLVGTCMAFGPIFVAIQLAFVCLHNPEEIASFAVIIKIGAS